MKFQIDYSRAMQNTPNQASWTPFLSGAVLGSYSFSSGSSVVPFLQTGIGVVHYFQRPSDSRTDGVLIAGVGLRVPYNHRISFLFSTDFRFPFGDNFPNYFSKLSEGVFCFSTGMEYHFPEYRENIVLRQLQQLNPEGEKNLDAILIEEYYQLQEVLKRGLHLRRQILGELRETFLAQKQMLQSMETQLASLQEFIQARKVHAQRLRQQPSWVTTIPGNVPVSESSVEQTYQKALNSFQMKDYRSSLEILSRLKNRYPDHPLASNFVYWIGECYFGLRDYSSAIKAFEEVRKYPYSPKKDDALIMAGISFYRLGNLDQASRYFRELLQTYPNSEYVKKCRIYLASLSRKIIS